MFPGMNINPKQMKQAMKKMGISQDEMDAQVVIIKLADRDLIFENPEVSKVNMMGQETYQIVGEPREELHQKEAEIEEEDIEIVMQQTEANKEDVIEAIKQAEGDLAQAIMILKKEE
ncbi:MAG: nascent polypeptide-associated complex protein [Candidatus Woesearchaeota archaeon]